MKRNQIAAVVVLIALLAWGVVDAYVLDKGAGNAATNGANSSVPIGLEKGNLAPDFELRQLGGDKVKLSDFRGKKSSSIYGRPGVRRAGRKSRTCSGFTKQTRRTASSFWAST